MLDVMVRWELLFDPVSDEDVERRFRVSAYEGGERDSSEGGMVCISSCLGVLGI